MHEFTGNLEDLGQPMDAARALLLAGLLDKVIFERKLRPADLDAAGIELQSLLPHRTMLLRTERLNRLLRMMGRRNSYRQLALLREWVAEWPRLIWHGIDIQVDDTNDRARLMPADMLIQFLSMNVDELDSITKVVRPKTFRTPAAELKALLLDGQRYFHLNGHQADAFADIDGMAWYDTVLVIRDRRGAVSPLVSTLALPATAPAIAAIFLLNEPEPVHVVSHLLEAVMVKMRLGFAAAIHVDEEQAPGLIRYLDDRRLRPEDLVDMISGQDRQFSFRRFGRDTWPYNYDDDKATSLIYHQSGFVREHVDDPRRRLDALLDAGFDKYHDLRRVAPGPAPEAAYAATMLQKRDAVKNEAERRYVQVRIRESEGPTCEVLYPASDYTVDVFLDSLLRGVAADRPFPSPSVDHDVKLDISLTPLYMTGDMRYSLGQVRSIVLPPVGKSQTASFTLRTPDDLRKFRARIVISHNTEVLQTLILALEPIAGDANLGIPYRLVVESDVTRRQAVARPEQAQFQLTLILNDNFSDAPGATLQTKNRALFTEPHGWQTFITDTQELLTALTSADLLPTSLSDGVLADSLRALAHQGANALEQLQNQAPDFDARSARYVQVIEAVNSTFVPIELFYDGVAPAIDAPMCPEAGAALARGHCACSQRDQGEVICPLAFWGVSKHIERRKNAPGASQSEVRIPECGPAQKIKLGQPLVALSQNVEKADSNRLQTTLATHFGAVHRADNWKAWTELVHKHQPQLQVLLPHSAACLRMPKQLALEINSDELLYAHITPLHVSAHNRQPVILMLGCETGLSSKFPLMNFASKFYAKGALTVLATLSEVRGQYVSRFAEQLAAELLTPGPAGAGKDFASALMTMKRNMLASGNAVGLTLVTYGDINWELHGG